MYTTVGNTPVAIQRFFTCQRSVDKTPQAIARTLHTQIYFVGDQLHEVLEHWHFFVKCKDGYPLAVCRGSGLPSESMIDDETLSL